jgi:DNA invertase Pin-like site-specific DNA recombinase/predicted nucleotidyltransferase
MEQQKQPGKGATMTTYGYARVSGDGQSLDDQVKQLSAAEAVTVFCEKVSGKSRKNWPELRKALAKLEPGDLLIITRLDRLARSLHDLLNIVEEIKETGAGFRSLADSDMIADPNSPTGRLVLSVLGSVADFERALIVDRTAAGRKRALAEGVKFGPKPKLTDYQKRHALERLDAGVESMRTIARSLNVSHSMLSRWKDERDAAAEIVQPVKKPKLDAETTKAGRSFLRHLKGRYVPLQALVYGSRARGTHRVDSDADIAVILKGRRGDRQGVAMDMAGIAFDVMQETGILIDPLPLWESDLKRPELFTNPQLIENIKREGLRL